MTQDVRQWLAEIKLLQQRLAETQKERDEAYTSASNWRNLYEAEAKQRRTERHLSQQAIESLQQELHQLRHPVATDEFIYTPPSDSTQDHSSFSEAANSLSESAVDRADPQADYQQRWLAAATECNRLAQALRQEQVAHRQTRQDLTTALGDAIEQLAPSARQANPRQSSPKQSSLS